MQCELVQKLDGKFPVLKNNGTHTNGITANANTWKSGTAIQCNATKEFIFVRPQLWSGLWTRQSGDLESSLCSPSIICKWCKQVAADLSHTEKFATFDSHLSRSPASSFNIFKRKIYCRMFVAQGISFFYFSFFAQLFFFLWEIYWFFLHRTTFLMLFLHLLNSLSSNGYLTKRPRWPLPLFPPVAQLSDVTSACLTVVATYIICI